jgi:hypothetical protein
MVFDGKQDKSLRILLEKWLIDLLGLNCGRRRWFRLLSVLDLFDLWLLLFQVCEGGPVDRLVLLVGRIEIYFLDGRINLEGINSGSGLN